MHRKKRRLRKQAKIIIFLTTSILIFVGIIIIGRSQIHLREDGYLTFEVGQPISLSPDDYFTLFFYSDKEKEKMSENLNVRVDLSRVNSAKCSKLINCYLSLFINNKGLPIDTAAPSACRETRFIVQSWTGFLAYNSQIRIM